MDADVRSDLESYDWGREEDYVLRQWVFWEKQAREEAADDVADDSDSPF